MKLNKRNLNYKEIAKIAESGETITIDPLILKNLEKQRKKIRGIISKGNIVYGLNTGFGALKTKNIPHKDIQKLQENLIRSHAVGVGNPFPETIVKIIMLLIVNYLSKGFSGVRPIVLETLISMLNNQVIPVVPEKGSVGSSGDLAPSAHIMLVLIGRGEAYYKGKLLKGSTAMKQAGIKPLKLEAKEGLALINNTATMTANAILALVNAEYLADIADICAALSIEALRATDEAFDERIHSIKPHQGQILVAKRIRDLIKGSTMIDRERVQDQYSIRCVPQIHGAIRGVLDYAKNVVSIETNSVTDNPLVFSNGEEVEFLSGGNFHGEAVAIAMDSLRLALCEYANISDRRITSILDPNHNFGLPAFLAKNPGLNSGMMILQYTTAALVSENKILAHPASVDSIPTSANIEDLVSMGTISSRKTLEVIENIINCLAIELFISCQAIDFRLQEGFKLGKGTGAVFKKIRSLVPFIEEDQEYMEFVKELNNQIKNRLLV